MRTARKIASLRKEYTQNTLPDRGLPKDPLKLFQRWFGQAVAAGLREPNAMVLSTATSAGRPSSRVVLMKGIDKGCILFFTNYRSRKGRELAHNAAVSLLYFWPDLERQVRIEGRARRTTRAASVAYFRSRPRESQLGAWASDQSHRVTDRASLDRSFAAAVERFAGTEIPCPAWWGGIAVKPSVVEFWQGGPNRMHDRIVYRRKGSAWSTARLQP